MSLMKRVGVALVFAVAGCGGGGTDGGSTPGDIAMAGSPDLAMSGSPDLAMAASPDLAMAAAPDLAMAAAPDLVMGGPKTVTVLVGQGGNNFSPMNQTIKVGDSIKWVWMSNNHNVVSGNNGTPDNKFCSRNDMNCANSPLDNTGATYTHKFAAAGSFPYYCAPHVGAGMRGTITVQ